MPSSDSAAVIAPSSPPTAVPAVPDHDVLRRIGRGAYGEIWLAQTRATAAWRAVKIVRREDFNDERAFRREFEGLAAFEPISRSHDGFVDILQVGRTDAGGGFLYYVMELADDLRAGDVSAATATLDPAAYRPRSLRAELSARWGNRLPAAECVELGVRLSEALGALHTHGLSHRDLKPDNVIFVRGRPMLADIGLVAAHGQRSFVGTEGYVPPEGPGGASADLYALGKVLYECAMGRDRLEFPAWASDLTAAPDAPSDAAEDDRLRRGLNTVLLRACDPKPDRRYGSAAAMTDDLRRLQSGKPPRRRVRHGMGSAAAWIALVFLLTLLAAGWWRMSNRERAPEKKNAPPVEAVDPTPVPTATPVGKVSLRSQPEGAEVFDGAQQLGVTPLTVELPAGEHELLARFSGWPDQSQRVLVRAPATEESETPVQATFEFPPGAVRLESEPPGALVHLGERALGETPLTVGDLPPGAATFAFTLPGHRRATSEVAVVAGETATARVTLEPGRWPTPGARWENSLGMRFVPLPDAGAGNGASATLLSVWETRLRDFTAFVEATGYDATGGGMSTLQNGDSGARPGTSWRAPGFPQTPEHPVVGVSWKDAYAFCDWLTQQEHEIGFLDEGQFYRLPTDAEWSRAAGLPPENGATPQARSGRVRGIYPWGTQWPPPASAGNYAGAELRAPGADWPATWRTLPNNDGFPRTAPVGSFAPNPLGLHDLGGNAWEWCEDRFAPGGETRVLRGGAWANVDAELLLASKRIEAFPHAHSDLYGFRVVLETPAFGSVEIASEPAGAEVFRGEERVGQTPCVLTKIAPGDVAFRVRLEGRQPVVLSGRVAVNERLKLHAALPPTGGPSAGQPWENGLGMKFAPVGERLLFSIWETRVSDFAAFCRETGRTHPATDFEQGPAHPVVNVNRDDAEAFCRWLTAREIAAGRLQSAQRYRLPTDREWSLAAGLPDETGDTPEARDGRVRGVYPWGRTWPPPPGSGNYADPAVAAGGKSKPKRRTTPAGEPYAQTAPAGSFAPNAFGLHDLAGNVWEWCADPYKNHGALRQWGVLRGGSWADYGAGILLSSYRNVVPAGERDVIYGFRCVIDLGN